MGVVTKAPEHWSEEEKKAYSRSTWENVLTDYVKYSSEGAALGAGVGSSVGPIGTAFGFLIGAAVGGTYGLISGGMKAADERKGMIAGKDADTQQAILSKQASKSAEVARDTQQKAAGRAGGMSDSQYDSLRGDLDTLAGGMPSSGNPYPTKDYGNRFKDYGW